MTSLLPLDMHAHIDSQVSTADLTRLRSHVFAMTRSLAEFATVSERKDPRTIWGVGLHPGLVRNQKAFSEEKFRQLLKLTPLVGEVGLDAKSRVSFDLQLKNFRSILEAVEQTPRIVSVHSYGATAEVIRELTRRPVKGIVLHWWLGSPAMTEEAVRLGCYFSVPPAMSQQVEVLRLIPTNRLLPETDHPSGDRLGPQPRRPGNVSEVERRLGVVLSRDESSMRDLFWSNLWTLARTTGTTGMFGEDWRRELEPDGPRQHDEMWTTRGLL